MIIPVGWEVPGAGPIVDAENRRGLEGTLESVPAKYRWRGVLGYAIGLSALLGVALALK